jgi:hypothetical protein
MTIQEAQTILNEEIVYKNTKFYITHDYPIYFIKLIVKFQVKDACSGYNYQISPIIEIKTNQTFDPSYFERMSKEEFIKIVYMSCRRLEMHELDEHFKINNKCLYEPHPQNTLTNKII